MNIANVATLYMYTRHYDKKKNEPNDQQAFKQEFFNRLAAQLISASLSYLPYNEVTLAASVSRKMQFCSQNGLLWHRLYCRQFDERPSKLDELFGRTKKKFKKKFFKIKNSYFELQPETHWCRYVSRYFRCQGDVNLIMNPGQHPEVLQSLSQYICKVYLRNEYETTRGIPRSVSICSEPEYPTILDFVLEFSKISDIWFLSLGSERLLRPIFEKRESEAVLTLNKEMFKTLECVLRSNNDVNAKQKIIEFLWKKGLDFSLKNFYGQTLVFSSILQNSEFYDILLPIIEKDRVRRVAKVCKEIQNFPNELVVTILNFHGLSDYFQVNDFYNRNMLHLFMEYFISNQPLYNRFLDQIGVDAIFQKDNAGQTPFKMALKRKSHCFDEFLQKNVSFEFLYKAYAAFEQEEKEQEEKEIKQLIEEARRLRGLPLEPFVPYWFSSSSS